MKLLADDVNTIIRKIFRNQHPYLAEIIINWPKIVGPNFSKYSSPQKITKSREKSININILHIQVENSSIGLQISYQQELILERIAVYLGVKAIHRIRLIVSSVG